MNLQHYIKQLLNTRSHKSEALSRSKKAVVTSFLTLKGGVGKTTLCAAAAEGLSQQGYRVLVVDFDPQANISLLLANNALELLNENSKALSIYEMLHENISPYKAIVPSRIKGLDIIISKAQNSLINQTRDSSIIDKMKHIFARLSKDYDYIFIDCAPTTSVSHALALAVSDVVISPMLLDIFSVQSIIKTISDVEDLKHKFNNKIQHKVIFNKVKQTDLNHKSDQIKEIIGNDLHLVDVPETEDEANYTTLQKELDSIFHFLKTRQADEKSNFIRESV